MVSEQARSEHGIIKAIKAIPLGLAYAPTLNKKQEVKIHGGAVEGMEEIEEAWSFVESDNYCR